MKHRTTHYFRKMSVLGLLLSGTLIAAGCGGDVGDEGTVAEAAQSRTYSLEDTVYTRNIEVFSNVKRLDDRAAMVVAIEPDRLMFPVSADSLISQYVPGDIMATSEGEGLLRRVERIERQGDSLVVFTSSADLSDVFASGEIYFGAHAEPGIEVPESFRYAPLAMQGEDLSSRGQALGLTKNWEDTLFTWNRDFASDINAKIANDYLSVEQASLDFKVGGEFYVDAKLGLPPLKTLRVGANGSANATLRIKLQSTDAFDFSKTYYLVSTDASDSPMHKLDVKDISIAGLVKLDFGVKASLKLDAVLSGELSATSEVQLNGNLQGGVLYQNKKWGGYTKAGFSPSGSGPDFDGDKEFDATAKLSTELTVTVSNKVKGSLKVQPAIVTVDFNQKIHQSGAQKGQCPYHFNVNVQGHASGQIASALGFPVQKSPSNWEIYNKDFLTKNGQLQLPLICDEDYVVPSFGNGARYPGMECTESNQCKTGVICQRNTCVTEGPLRFTAAWFDDTDLDLSVVTPSGDKVHWKLFSNASTDGFYYDFPNCTGKCKGKGSYVESIYTEKTPAPGKYIITLTHTKDRTDGAAGKVALLIDDNGKVTNEGGQIPAQGESISFEYVVK